MYDNEKTYFVFIYQFNYKIERDDDEMKNFNNEYFCFFFDHKIYIDSMKQILMNEKIDEFRSFDI